MWVYVEDYEKVISMYRKTSLPAEMWRSQPPTAQPRTQFKPVSAQLLWLDWQLHWPVKRRLGLLQYNWDIRPKPMSLTEGEWRIYASVSQVIIGPLIMAWRRFSAKPWSKAIFIVWSTAPLGTKDVQFQAKFKHFYSRKCIWKCHLQNGIYFASASVCLIKSSEILFVQNTHFCCRIIFKLGAKFGADTAVLCATFQNDLTTD